MERMNEEQANAIIEKLSETDHLRNFTEALATPKTYGLVVFFETLGPFELEDIAKFCRSNDLNCRIVSEDEKVGVRFWHYKWAKSLYF